MSTPISAMAATAKGSSSPRCTPAEPTYMVLPKNSRNKPAAIGERTEFSPQANNTACGRGGAAKRSALPVQHADQREQAARGVDVDLHFVLEPLHQDTRAVVVDGAPSHVERLDLVRRRRADRLIVAVADRVIVFHDTAQRRERKQMRDHRLPVLGADVEGEPIAGEAQVQRVGPA